MNIEEMNLKARENAEAMTGTLVDEFEDCVQGSKERAIIYGNTAIAAVKILFTRYGITKDDVDDLFAQHWAPQIARSSRPH